ncbi:ATP-binding protein [Asticcacaulis sp. ZE23SCel15]|uniref:PAS domain-containing sensor histidine kinase n=1 Tax=Asticcacaulis sp. ZE23SCel15 TaxID=3059027 RepID=UPI00265DD32D|nr:ATP-binding protein [Asticcacaulis sp. ZE23SCel15]WKL58175.1 ATP-binding protein [Asticcacaulis sp. ZE23SCel15]
MDVSAIALAVAGGSLALALSTTFLSWRQRGTLGAQRDALKADLGLKQTMLSELDAATSAFDEAFLAVEDDMVRLVWGDETLKACAEALGVSYADSDITDCAPQVLEALSQSSPQAEADLKALIEAGKPCRFEIFAEKAVGVAGKTLIVEGRPSGATAWIRLAIAGAQASLSSGPFAQMAEHLPAPCWIVSKDGRLVWANSAWLKAVEAESLADARERDLSLDRSADALVQEAVATASHREGFRWLTLDGQRRAFSVTVEPLSEGYFAAYALDVTEAEESRDALKRHAKAHDETLDRLEDAVAIFGPEKRLTFHNRAFETLWDLDPAWLAERPTHGELLDRLRQKRRLPEMGDYAKWKAQELEFYGLKDIAPDEMWSLPGGRSLKVVRQPHPLGGLLTLYVDKTDELKLKSQFNSLIQVQRATLDQLLDAVSVFGSDGRLRLRNAAFDAFWNLSAEDMVTMMDFAVMAELCLPLVHDKGFWAELKARVTDTDPIARAPQMGEVRVSDGRLARWRTQPLPDGATLVAFADITATRNLEQAIEDRDMALNKSVRLKREFVANVSYELRTPMTTIVGYSELMTSQSAGLNEKQLNYLTAIQSAGRELARSIDDVLDMAQMDAGEMQISLSDVTFGTILHDLSLRLDGVLATRNLRFEHTGLSDDTVIRVDPRRLGQMLDHLIDNAQRNAAADTAIVLKTDRDGDTLRLEVSHKGRGIPYDKQAHIFDRYVGRERGGPGLGLALVKALTELHGGWITLESEPSEGATFSIHLPHQNDIELPEPEATAQDVPNDTDDTTVWVA